MSVLAIVQARVGSTRLPRKMLAEICGVPVIAHTLRRVKAAQYLNNVCLAIPDTAENDVLAAIGESEGVRVYRGSENDLLSRFFWATEAFPNALAIVRICGEDVYTDPKLIDHLLTGFLGEWGRGTPNGKVKPPHLMELGGPTWAYGIGCTVFTKTALALALQAASSPSDREHVTNWLGRAFGVWTLKDSQHRATSETRLTIDTQDDLDLARAVYGKLYMSDPLFGYDETLAALHTETKLLTRGT